MRAQGFSIMPLIRWASISSNKRSYWTGRYRFEQQEYSQGGTYLQGASISQRREYPGESSDDDNVNRRPYRDHETP